MVKFIAWSFPSSSELKIWPFNVVFVRGRQRNAQKKRGTRRVNVLRISPITFFGVPVAVAVVVS